MNTTSFGYVSAFIMIATFFVGAGFASAQEIGETTIVTEVTTEVIAEEIAEQVVEEEIIVDTEAEVIMEEENDTLSYDEEVFTEEEAQDIFDNAEEINAEGMTEELVVGEVVVTDDAFIVLELEDGSFAKVAKTSSKSGQRKRTGAFIGLNKAQVGNVLTITPNDSVTSSAQGAGYVAATNTLTLKNKPAYVLTPGTSVVLNGEEGDLSDLEVIGEESLVTVITDENGDVIAVTILDEVEAEGNKKAWPWILAVIVLLGGIMLMTLKNEEGTEM